jgi:serine/threonine protein kinase
MEYMEKGTLHEVLTNTEITLSPEMQINFLRDIAQGMRFLHMADPPVIHGDLKGRNILVGGAMRAKVADIGIEKTSWSGRPEFFVDRREEDCAPGASRSLTGTRWSNGIPEPHFGWPPNCLRERRATLKSLMFTVSV